MPSFKQAHVISNLRNRPLSETRKAYSCLSHFVHNAQAVKAVARHKMKARRVFQENVSVSLKCSKMQKEDSGRCIAKHEERVPTN